MDLSTSFWKILLFVCKRCFHALEHKESKEIKDEEELLRIRTFISLKMSDTPSKRKCKIKCVS